MDDIVKAYAAIIRILPLNAEGLFRTNVSFRLDVRRRPITKKEGLLCTGGRVPMTTAELERLCVIILYADGINPNTLPAEGTLETLDADDREKYPEESDEKCNID